MARFRFTALNGDGVALDGDIVAQTEREAALRMARDGRISLAEAYRVRAD